MKNKQQNEMRTTFAILPNVFFRLSAKRNKRQRVLKIYGYNPKTSCNAFLLLEIYYRYSMFRDPRKVLR